MRWRIQLLLAVLSIGCGSGADVLYVGAAAESDDGGRSLPEAGSNGIPEAGAREASLPEAGIEAGIEAGALDSVCTPAVDFQNLDPTGGGKVFTDVVSNPVAFVQSVTQKVCRVLYTSPSSVPAISKITYAIGPLPPSVSGTTGGTTTTISSQYLMSYASSHAEIDTLNEITGLTIQHFTSIYELYKYKDQAMPSALPVLSGINVFARYALGYLSIAVRQKGGAWSDGRETTAFFFAYLDATYPSFVRRLNAAIANGYDPVVFQTLTGRDVDTLWAQYQSSF